MASTTQITAAPLNNPQTRGGGQRGGRGTRGGYQEGRYNAHEHGGQRGGRRGYRGSRGQQAGLNSNQHTRRIPNSTLLPAPSIPPPPGLGGGGSFGERPAEDASTTKGEGEVRMEPGGEVDVEAEVCFICASPVEHNCVAPCNHRTCHICALRMRALYKKTECTHCRSEAKFVIFTDDNTKRYEDYVDTDFEQVDEFLGIKYEKNEIYDDTVLLLRYNCPDGSCDIACWGWPDLHRHVKSIHQKIMCDLCSRNKKVFTHEHSLFTAQGLRKHEKFGDDDPGAIDQSGFRGHPECGFCRERFYGDDELYTHCRDKHERCHICDRNNQGREQQYFVDYNSLEQHFTKDHFLCVDQECLEKKFVVFSSEMDLKAHQLETHPNGLSKDARKDARRVNISTFDYRLPHQDNQGGRRGRDGRGRGRGRDPNTEALPQSTAQPLRRDELAYQRQMAIQSAQSVSTHTSGSQLSSTDAYAARPSSHAQHQPTILAPRGHTSTNPSFPAIDNLNIGSGSRSPESVPTSPAPQNTLTPQDQARRLRHNAVMERASNMLKGDQTKIADFRNRVSSYRTSAISASQLIDTFFSLFDASSTDLGKLIKELAEIYENEARRNDLLKAWNDWRAINEDYPSLPGPGGLLPGSSSATTVGAGRRILKLKNSTAQSSRSPVNRHGSWGNAAPSNPFPPIPAASANRAGPGHVGATPWVTPSSSRLSPAPVRPTSTVPAASRGVTEGVSDAFPALPAAAKPNTTIFGLHRGAVNWDDGRGGTPTNPWGGNASSSVKAGPTAATETEAEFEAVGGKKKGNRQKKQTLYKFG